MQQETVDRELRRLIAHLNRRQTLEEAFGRDNPKVDQLMETFYGITWAKRARDISQAQADGAVRDPATAGDQERGVAGDEGPVGT